MARKPVKEVRKLFTVLLSKEEREWVSEIREAGRLRSDGDAVRAAIMREAKRCRAEKEG